MRRMLIVVAFTVSMSSFVLCRQANQSADDVSKAVQAVMKLESRWVRAVLRRDAKALEGILADDYVGTSSDGKVRSKAQTLKELRAATLRFESLTPYDFDVRVSGDTTTLTGRMVVKMMLKGQVVSSRFSYARVYVHSKGRWRVAQSRTTRIAEQ